MRKRHGGEDGCVTHRSGLSHRTRGSPRKRPRTCLSVRQRKGVQDVLGVRLWKRWGRLATRPDAAAARTDLRLKDSVPHGSGYAQIVVMETNVDKRARGRIGRIGDGQGDRMSATTVLTDERAKDVCRA